MRIVLALLLVVFLSSCQASGTHKGANLFANILTLEF